MNLYDSLASAQAKTPFSTSSEAIFFADHSYLLSNVDQWHLFLKPSIVFSETVGIPVPAVDAATCTSCGKCAEVCEFNAIAMLKKPLVFPELCQPMKLMTGGMGTPCRLPPRRAPAREGCFY